MGDHCCDFMDNENAQLANKQSNNFATTMMTIMITTYEIMTTNWLWQRSSNLQQWPTFSGTRQLAAGGSGSDHQLAAATNLLAPATAAITNLLLRHPPTCCCCCGSGGGGDHKLAAAVVAAAATTTLQMTAANLW